MLLGIQWSDKMNDRCPGCKRQLASENIAEVLRLRSDQAMLAVCAKCGEVIYLRPVSRCHISGMVPTREMMVDFDPAFRLKIHEEQEKAHFANGHWG
jgi:uncharacterized protein with PIN domain